MPSTDQHEAVVAAVEGFPQPRDVGDERFRREFDSARTCSEHLRESRLQRTEVDAVRCGLEPFQGQAVGIGAERVAVGAQPKHHVEAAFISRPGDEHRGQFVDRTAGDG